MTLHNSTWPMQTGWRSVLHMGGGGGFRIEQVCV
jgi:hypothetical protein